MAAAGPKNTDKPENGASGKPGSRRRRLFFLTFKWIRIAILLFVFVVIVLGLFLNHVGLPGWAENRILRRIEAYGWKVQFSRLRLRWYHGIVAEDLILQRTNTLTGPHLFLHSAEFRPNWSALAHLRLESEGVALKDGRLIWPLPGTNQAARTIQLDKLAGELVFRPNDIWELKFLESDGLNAHVRFRGEITNASVLREWSMTRPPGQPSTPAEHWHRLLSDLEKIKFTTSPSAQIIFHGDARDWRGFSVQVRLNALDVNSPWGRGTNVTALARTIPPHGSNDPIRLSVAVGAEQAQTPWANASRLELRLEVEPALDHIFPTNAVLSAELREARTQWGRARRLSIEARSEPLGSDASTRRTRVDLSGEQVETPWGDAGELAARIAGQHGPTNYLPARVETTLTAKQLGTRWLTSQWSHVELQAELPPLPQFNLGRSNFVWLDRLTNLPFQASVTVSNGVALGYVVDRASTTIDWRDPAGHLTTDLAAGEATLVAQIDVDARTREIRFTNATTAQPAAFARFLSTDAQRWLAHFDSLRTPSFSAQGRFTVPSWQNWTTNTPAEIWPTVEMRGQLEAPSASFDGLELVHTSVPFAVTNRVWDSKQLRLVRPEGELRVQARANETNGEFQIDLVSSLNPLTLQPILTNAEPVFRWFELKGEAPALEAQFSGNWHDWSTLAGTANVRLTNFVFRGVPIDSATARLTYRDQWLGILHPVVLRPGGERGVADGLAIDLREPRLYLTNATGRLTPLAIGQMIGPITKRTIEPYVFELPPNARVEGSIPLGRTNRGTEYMRFEIDGGRFDWNVLHFDRLKGTVIWQGEYLTLTNMSGLWRGGIMEGWAFFNFDAPRGGSMAYDATFAGNSLKSIVTDFQRGRTNRLEGSLSGRLRVTQADVNDLNSWDGYGFLNMHEGLIWDIPLFGLLSPILNTVKPGLGNSRAKEGRATFTMTNSVVHSQNLEIVANTTRLRYQGKVDFEGNVTARVEADLMREFPGIGRLISTVFWPVTEILKYSVTGTLDKPKLEPVNAVSRMLTKFIALPFMPFKALNEILTPDKKDGEKKE
jgi:hypothetical protein